MSDGSRLRQSWYSSLNEAEAYFRQLLTSPSADWKRTSSSGEGSSSRKGKPRVSAAPELADVIVHRNLKSNGGEDVYRVMLEIPTTDDMVNLEPWKAVLTTPELRQEWDPAVEDAHLLEIFDHSTRISKTHYTLGWPANPRDAVTISRSFNDSTTVVDISTSLPRSVDEPAYLRPSPPFVRSHVHLFAWAVQHIQNQQRIRITCFWQHDFKAMWGLGSSSTTLAQQLSTMVLSLFKAVTKRGGRVPGLVGYGNGVSIERVRFQMDREALTIDYAIIPDEDGYTSPTEHEIHVIREQRRLTRSIECVLPSLEGWEVQISLKASSEAVEQLPWSAHALKANSNPSSIGPPDQIILRFTHSALLDDHSVLKVKVVIEAAGGTRGLRLNGLPKQVHDTEQRDPSSYSIPQPILQDIASAADLSIQTASSMGTVTSGMSSTSSIQTLTKPQAERTPMAEKSILSRVRRNYIYFSSLLQEPEAKWRRTTDGRGVSITQLDSIDPTLVVYRAEATFVGVGLWDLYGTVVSPGARVHWDKQHDDAVLLEDVNELSELWYYKSKPAWPVHGRDSVVLKTVYKSPNVIHVFSFSADDPHLFGNIPPVDPNTIRTQVDLQGWSIEALSPTTTSLTLLEQSDPKGWTNKTSIPTYMINTLAGIGEFAIKCGGPPIVTRLTGAKANDIRYDHEKGSFRVEYEASARRRTTTSSTTSSTSRDTDAPDDTNLPSVECEIRCDVDTWALSLDIVVDPPPQTMTCLRRHRLSSDGGGLWLTLTHDCVFVDDERLLVLIRRAPGKEKGLVMVNGAKIQVDVEDIPEHELKALSKQKRVKPPRIPLDQPPVVGVVRKRREEWSHENTSKEGGSMSKELGSSTLSGWASAPRISGPFTRLFSYAVDQATTTTQQYVAAITPANSHSGSSIPSATKFPLQYALEALAWTQDFHNSTSFQSSSLTDGWTLVNDKGVTVLRKPIPEVSPIIPVHKGSKVIEGASAEELASIISDDNCRRIWDDRFDSCRTLEAYGNSFKTQFLTAKGGFPFRDRGFHLASVVARTQLPSVPHGSSALSRRNTNDPTDQTKNATFVVSASFSAESITPLFSAAKYNFYALPIGRIYLDAWVLETLDPYTTESYAIPSTRCTRLVAVDYAGSIPAAVNSLINAGLPRAILALESCFKAMSSSLPMTRLPAPCVVLAEKKGEDRLATVSWKLKKHDERRLLVEESYTTETKVYRASILVNMALSSSTTASNKARSPSSGSGLATSLSAPITSSLEAPLTPRPTPSRTLSHSRSRTREGSESTVIAPPMGHSRSRSSSSSSSSSHKYLETSSSTETLRSVRSYDAPLNVMPGTISVPPTLQFGSPGSTLLRPFRQRSASSTDGRAFNGTAYHTQYATSPSTFGTRLAGTSSVASSPPPTSHVRGRTVSTVFTARGEVRPLKDFIVGELVVDTRLYPDGYSVVVRSRVVRKPKKEVEGVTNSASPGKDICLAVEGKDKGKGREGVQKDVFLKMGSLKIAPSDEATGTDAAATAGDDKDDDDDDDNFLPISHSIYTMPSSPLHSSSLNPEGGATRHLLQLKLPTAQYWVSSVRDPLTGQIRHGPPKPRWLKVLEGDLDAESDENTDGGATEKGDGDERKGLKGVVVDVEIRPVVVKDQENDKGDDKERKRRRVKRVNVNAVTVSVVGEKESLSSLGRDELLDEQVGKMGILSRVPNETEALPEELILPTAIADDVVDPAVWGESGAAKTDSASLINTTLGGGSNTSGSSFPPHPDGASGKKPTDGTSGEKTMGEKTPGMPLTSSITSSGTASGASSSSSGIWNLWPSYRFGFGGSVPAAGNGITSVHLEANPAPRKLDGEIGDDRRDDGNESGVTTQIEDDEKKGGVQVELQPTPPARAAKQYPLSTLLAVALIAFLIGSLLRSLLSPADFIYVAEAEEASKVNLAGGNGWREIKRLFELKYILGGWDFQVAAVRRHPL